jgi:hypothetical protein
MSRSQSDGVRDRRTRLPLAAGVLTVICLAGATLASAQTARPPTLFFDAAATDGGGSTVARLRPRDLRVVVDGEPRPVVTLRYVVRGPGAEALAVLRGADAETPVAVEPRRLVVLAVDETTMDQADVKPTVDAVAVVLDELGGQDQAAVVTLPAGAGGISLTSDPVVRMENFGRVVGRASDPSSIGTAAMLVRVIEQLTGLPGLKNLVLFRHAELAGRPTPPAEQQHRDIQAVVDAAARSRTVVHLVVIGSSDSRSPLDEDLREAVARSGGTQTSIRRASNSKAFDALRAALSGGYLVEVEGRNGDSDHDLHNLQVQAVGTKVVVRTPRSLSVRPDPVPGIVLPAGGTSPERKQDTELAALLQRMRDYLSEYVRDFGNLVGEEDYWQHIAQGWRGGPKTRRLKSDLLLVSTTDVYKWQQYRDVFQVDGQAVRDREDRIRKLFLENSRGAATQAQRVSGESARYNIGEITRTVNLPTLPLVLLTPAWVDGLSFQVGGEDAVEGRAVTRVSFKERRSPTMIRRALTNRDVPCSGVLWIDTATGRIVKTMVRMQADDVLGVATVIYRPGGPRGLWVPSEMHEVYRRLDYEVVGEASYSNFRSFNVTTETKIGK